MTLDLDLDTTIVAAVKAIIDTHLESAWRASGVRILRSDLPFGGINLRYQNRLLAMDEVLSSCKIGKDSTIDAEWPHEGEKYERREHCGRSWDQELMLKRRKRADRGNQRAKKASRGSNLEEIITQPVAETDGNEQISSGSVSGNRLDENTEIEAGGDGAAYGAEGTQGLDEQAANAARQEQQNEEGHGARPSEGAEQDDPFADEDDDKENRAPEAFVPVVVTQIDQSPAEEWPAFDESNSSLGLDLLEEAPDL